MTQLCLDNTFVSDYLAGKKYTRHFLTRYIGNADVYVPTLVRFEAYVPAFQEGGDRNITKAKKALSGFKLVGLDENQAEEAAEIRAKLIDSGEQIGAPDVIIAGVARQMGAKIVTSDGHFDRVPDLETIDPKSH